MHFSTIQIHTNISEVLSLVYEKFTHTIDSIKLHLSRQLTSWDNISKMNTIVVAQYNASRKYICIKS